MPQYVVRAVHTSDQCPTANSKVRERVTQGMTQLPQLAQQLGVKILTGPLILATEHETIAIVEAGSIETVEDFVLQSGLMQWNSVRVSSARPLQDAPAEFGKMPPPLY
jgi:hypothetical protein